MSQTGEREIYNKRLLWQYESDSCGMWDESSHVATRTAATAEPCQQMGQSEVCMVELQGRHTQGIRQGTKKEQLFKTGHLKPGQ